jgi:hypothetical protein
MALTSPFSKLYKAIKDRITATVAAIRYINQDWGQLNFEQPPISYKALLIDFPETIFTQMQAYQDGKATVRLTLIYRSFTDTSNLAPGALEETALAFYELEQQVYEALQAWDADGLLVNDLIRTNATTEKRDDGLRVRVIDFECTFCDASVTA